MKKIILSILSLVAISPSVFAGSVLTKLSRVGVATDQFGMMIVDSPAPSKPTCAEEFTILSFDKSTPHGRDMYSMALLAMSSNKSVLVEYSDTDCGLWGTRILVYRLDILRDF